MAAAGERATRDRVLDIGQTRNSPIRELSRLYNRPLLKSSQYYRQGAINKGLPVQSEEDGNGTGAVEPVRFDSLTERECSASLRQHAVVGSNVCYGVASPLHHPFRELGDGAFSKLFRRLINDYRSGCCTVPT